MRWLFAPIFLATGVLICACRLSGQNSTIISSICEVARNPTEFDNKMVRLRATLAANFEISAIRDPDDSACGPLWFSYPGGGPEAMFSVGERVPIQPRPVVHLKENEEFRQFRRLVDARMHPRQPNMICMDCKGFEVTALMVGLVEFAGPERGFGHMNGFAVQFVLQSVEQSTVKVFAPNYNQEEYSITLVRFPSGYIKGTLVGPAGRLIPDGNLNVYSVPDPSAHIENDSATTDRKGHFSFAVPPGKYIIGFNTFWPPSPNFPFPPTYYPSARQRSAAKVMAGRFSETFPLFTLLDSGVSRGQWGVNSAGTTADISIEAMNTMSHSNTRECPVARGHDLFLAAEVADHHDILAAGAAHDGQLFAVP